MLKRKILAAVLPVVAAGTVVGSGFSAWYFGNLTADSKSTSLSIYVEDEVTSIGNVVTWINASNVAGVGVIGNGFEYDELNYGLRIVLDQGKDVKAGDRITETDRGLHFEYTTDNDATSVTWNTLTSIGFKYSISEAEYNKLDSANLDIQLNFGVTINAILDRYISIKDGYGWCGNALTENLSRIEKLSVLSPSPSAGTYSFVFFVDLSTDVSSLSDTYQANKFVQYDTHNKLIEEGEEEVEPTTPTFEGKPTTHEELEEMKTTLKDVDPAFTFSMSSSVVTKN